LNRFTVVFNLGGNAQYENRHWAGLFEMGEFQRCRWSELCHADESTLPSLFASHWLLLGGEFSGPLPWHRLAQLPRLSALTLGSRLTLTAIDDAAAVADLAFFVEFCVTKLTHLTAIRHPPSFVLYEGSDRALTGTLFAHHIDSFARALTLPIATLAVFDSVEPLSAAVAAALFGALQANSSLRALRMCCASFTDHSCTELITALACGRLTEFAIEGAAFVDRFGVCVADSLTENRTLQKLSFKDTAVTTVTSVAAFEAIAESNNCSLCELKAPPLPSREDRSWLQKHLDANARAASWRRELFVRLGEIGIALEWLPALVTLEVVDQDQTLCRLPFRQKWAIILRTKHFLTADEKWARWELRQNEPEPPAVVERQCRNEDDDDDDSW
jgi:hypothetical protein